MSSPISSSTTSQAPPAYAQVVEERDGIVDQDADTAPSSPTGSSLNLALGDNDSALNEAKEKLEKSAEDKDKLTEQGLKV